jgi:hypothetical protein
MTFVQDIEMKNSTIHQLEIYNRSINEFKKYCDDQSNSDKTNSDSSDSSDNSNPV